MSDLRFDAESHRYFLGDRELLSVTRVLELSGEAPVYDGDPWYGHRGTLVHQACALYTEGDLDTEKLDLELVPYVAAWKGALVDMGMEGVHPDEHEMQLHDASLGIAGTMDVRLHSCEEWLVGEIKTASREQPYFVLQTAAYQLMAGLDGRIIIYLRPDGSHKIVRCQDDEGDKQRFLAALERAKVVICGDNS